MQWLRENPAKIQPAVEELLRYESPSQHTARLAPADVELGGKQIKYRQAVIAVLAAGNRDPQRFSDPDTLDLERKENRHLAFGWAAHFCFGAPLAKIEGQIAFNSLLKKFPALAIAPETPLVWRENLGLRGLKKLPVLLQATAAKLPETVSVV
jgi:cytochrome P450